MVFEKEKVSVVIPAFEEEKTISSIVNACKKYSGDVIVAVGEKSSDKTFEFAKKAGANVFFDDGKGMGSGLLEGIKKAKNEIVVLIDADGSHEPADIPKLVAPIFEGKADLVIASRMKGGSDELSGTFSQLMRNIGGSLIMLTINYRWNVRLTDCINAFRAAKKNVLLELNLKGKSFDIEQEMVMKALKKGYKVDEIASHEFARKFGESNINLLKIGWIFVWRLLIDLF